MIVAITDLSLKHSLWAEMSFLWQQVTLLLLLCVGTPAVAVAVRYLENARSNNVVAEDFLGKKQVVAESFLGKNFFFAEEVLGNNIV